MEQLNTQYIRGTEGQASIFTYWAWIHQHSYINMSSKFSIGHRIHGIYGKIAPERWKILV